MRQGWHTSIGANGKAHFYVDDKPACGDRKGIWPGVTLAELFTRPTRVTTDEAPRGTENPTRTTSARANVPYPN